MSKIYFLASIALAIGAATFVAIAAPDRPAAPTPKKNTPPPVPQIAGESHWGTVAQTGRNVVIDGHPQWSATGEFRPDGTLYLLWVFRDTGRPAPSEYSVEPTTGRIVGLWQYAEHTFMDEDGRTHGLVFGDVLRGDLDDD